MAQWLDVKPGQSKSMMFYCSECLELVYYPQDHYKKSRDGFRRRCGYKYCPYCRAEMEFKNQEESR